MVNIEFIKCVLESMFQKYSIKYNSEIIFKRDKIVFSKNYGCRKSFVGVQKETALTQTRPI